MSDNIYFLFDEDGQLAGVGDASENAKAQRQFLLDMIDLIDDDKPDWADVMPHLMKMPDEMLRSVNAVTIGQLLSIIHEYADFTERNGIESKAEFRQRWHKAIGEPDEGDADG